MPDGLRAWLWTLLLLTATAAVAGEEQTRPVAPMPQTGWQTDLGVGLIANPEYQGAEDYRVLPVPYFDVRYVDARGTKLFFSVPQGFGGYLIRERLENGARFALSAAVGPGFQNRDPEDVSGIDTFGIGLETRIGTEYDTGPWSFQASLAKAIASGHEGMYGNLSASYRFAISNRAFAGIGPSLRFGDDRYMSALYGVSQRESAASGLAAFDAGSGLESVGVQGLVSFPVGDTWRFTGVARLGRLMNDADDSSLTVEPTQAFLVVALTRRF
ncbi:MAG: MipA/OmpV family protein [Gammaproteobacteria bacterium]|jgi:outer membrane scaffolding protein for murein synthesis (MipA/OmpV family)